MKPIRTGRRGVGAAVLVAAAMGCGGCSEELGPVPMPVARAHGAVRMGDRPVSGGWIEFIPIGETIGNLRSGRLRSDGTFNVEGVAVGTNAIRVVDAPIESESNVLLFARLKWAGLVRQVDRRKATALQARLFVPFATPIRRTVAADANAPIEVDLVAEAMKFQEEMGRAMAGTVPAKEEGP